MYNDKYIILIVMKGMFMAVLIENLEMVLEYVVSVCTIMLEMVGITVLVWSAVRCFFGWIHKDQHVRLDLAQGIALALEFKMGGEVLRTVVVREWRELGILGAIILLRGLLTFLIHWEIENEKKELQEHAKKGNELKAQEEAEAAK